MEGTVKKMKNKLILLLCLVLAISAMLISCDGGDADGESAGNCIFDKNNPPTLIYSDDLNRESSALIYQTVKTAIDGIPEYYTPDSEEGTHEIVVGVSDRAVSRKAYRKLRTLQRQTDDSIAWLIYASGGSVAIAYDEDFDDLAEIEAVEYFVNNYISGKSSLYLDPGVVYSKVFSTHEYYQQLDAEYRASRIEALREFAGDDLADAMLEYLESYNPMVATWYANLYDPAIGGFYYSNSARDTEGYLPDLESTAQALSFINSGGVSRIDGGGYRKTLPSFMRNEIIVWVNSLYDASNGNYYHPQWNRTEHATRLARDRHNASEILSNLGSAPDPNYVPRWNTSIVTDLGTTSAVAASRVVAAATVADEFSSLEKFKEYLDNAVKNSGTMGFYSIGHNMTTRFDEIKNADKVLGTTGTDRSLVKYLIEFFNKHQNPELGLWENVLNYNGVNGLMKISGVYSKAGAPIPNAEKAAKSAMMAIASNEAMGEIVDIYNPWTAVKGVISNIKQHQGKDKAETLLNELRELAPEYIRITIEKVKLFEKPDGSYSYTPSFSIDRSQGMPVAVPGTYEGDVNGTVLASNYLWQQINGVLELPNDCMSKIYGAYERRLFLEVIYAQKPVQKIYGVVEGGDTTVIDTYPIDFNEETVGKPSEYVTSSSTDAIEVIKETDTDNALRFTGVSGKSASVKIPNEGGQTGSLYVFEGNFSIHSSGTTARGYLLQVRMGSSYMMAIRADGGKVIIQEATTESDGTAIYNTVARVPFDSWFKLRIEFYKGTKTSTRIKIFVDDELVSVSDYYKGKTKTNQDTNPNLSGLGRVELYKMKDFAVKMDMDDLHVYTVDGVKYKPATDEDTKVIYDVDRGGAITPPDTGSGDTSGDSTGGGTTGGGTTGGGTTDTPVEPPKNEPITFDGETVGEAPTSVALSGGVAGAVVAQGAEERGNILYLASTDKSGYITVTNNGVTSGSCYFFEGSFRIAKEGSSTSSTLLQWRLGTAYMLMLNASSGSLTLQEATTESGSTAIYNNIGSVKWDEWFDLRIEYYPGTADTVRIKVYLNGDLISVSDNYKGKLKSGEASTPKSSGGSKTEMYKMSGKTVVMEMDDLLCGANDTVYTPATDADTKVVYDVERGGKLTQ